MLRPRKSEGESPYCRRCDLQRCAHQIEDGTRKDSLEPKPVCTSTKRDKTESMMETSETTESVVPGVPGTEVTQMIVDTMAKTLQKSLQAIVKPDDDRSKHNAYKNPIKDGSIDDWVVLMKMILGNS